MTKSELKKLLKTATTNPYLDKQIVAKHKLQDERFTCRKWATDGVTMSKYTVYKDGDRIASFTAFVSPAPKLTDFKWEEGAKYYL